MRGSYRGALSRTYMHSAITESLWNAVTEIDTIFSAKLAHAVMVASMYGNPDANLTEGNDQIHEMYIRAVNTIPYISAASVGRKSDTDALVEEWRRLNAEAAEKSEASEKKEVSDGDAV